MSLHIKSIFRYFANPTRLDAVSQQGGQALITHQGQKSARVRVYSTMGRWTVKPSDLDTLAEYFGEPHEDLRREVMGVMDRCSLNDMDRQLRRRGFVEVDIVRQGVPIEGVES